MSGSRAKSLLTELHSQVLEWKAMLMHYSRWKDHVPCMGLGPMVSYGQDEVPSKASHAAGGIIKLQDLVEVFPNVKQGANLLYLVSSALPRAASQMVRRAKRRGVRLVLNQNGVAYPGWCPAGWQRINDSLRGVIEQADYVFYQSRFCRLAADRFLGLRQGPAEILYNPVDTAIFKPAGINPAPGKLVLLISGSHWSWYRVATAIRTLALCKRTLPNAELTIAGRFCWESCENTARNHVVQLCSELKVSDSVKIRGSYSQQDAVGLLQSAHILLHTKYNDPCPRLVVEAMACGLPAVYSGTGGVPELVGECAGIGVPGPLDWEEDHPPDPAALACAVEKVARDYDKFSLAARQRAVSEFDVKPWIERHRVVFNTMA